jgi:hypothetical protein
MARAKRPGGTLSVDTQILPTTVDVMGLDLGQVVRDIEHKWHVNGPPQPCDEGLTGFMAQDVTVGPGEIRCRRHGSEIALTLSRTHWHTCELAIRDIDSVAMHRITHRP